MESFWFEDRRQNQVQEDRAMSLSLTSAFKIPQLLQFYRASQVALVVRNPPANAGDIIGSGSIPGSGRSSWGGQGNLLQYSCLGNPVSRGAWQARATVHGVTKSRTQLKQLSMRVYNYKKFWNILTGSRNFFFLKKMFSSSTRDWILTPCMGRWSLNHWMPRKSLRL